MQKHQGTTDEVKQIKLPSSIEEVVWTQRIAAPDGTVGLEIHTQFVGNGADLQIELSDGQGRKHGTFKEQITGNRFWTPIRVPAKAEQALVATVKLPKHGLEMRSPALLLMPPVQISNPEWSEPEAREGDVLTITADVKGAPDGTEAGIVIFEHDADGAHDLVTEFPALIHNGRVEAEWEMVYQEDRDDIPTDEEVEGGYRHPEYYFRIKVGGVEASSEVVRFKDWLELQYGDARGGPIGGERYVLHLADGSTREGTLDEDGFAREDDLPPGPVRYEYPDRETF